MIDLPLSTALSSVLGAAVDGTHRPALLAAMGIASTPVPETPGQDRLAPVVPLRPPAPPAPPAPPGPDHPRAA